MPNELLTTPEQEEQERIAERAPEPELWANLEQAETPVWKTLVENIRERFNPPKLPPLELTSQPIPVPDPMEEKRGPWPKIISTVVNLTILGVLIWLSVKHIIPDIAKKPIVATDISVAPPLTNPAKVSMGGGGGGGSHDIIPASKGKIPPLQKVPLTPPVAKPLIEQPKLPVPPAINVQQMKMPNQNLPNFGMITGGAVLSNGSGNNGIGSGSGGGVGSGSGNGLGPGSGGNTGGGVYRIGGGVSPPEVIYKVDPEFSDEARKAKYQGLVDVYIVVDATGHVRNARVVHPIGMGLDERAVEAAKQYRFKPAMKDGQPVAVSLILEVDFRIY